jgi:hypothetical protein
MAIAENPKTVAPSAVTELEDLGALDIAHRLHALGPGGTSSLAA